MEKDRRIEVVCVMAASIYASNVKTAMEAVGDNGLGSEAVDCIMQTSVDEAHEIFRLVEKEDYNLSDK